MMNDQEKVLFELKKQEFMLEREKLRLIQELPHLYGFPWYRWAKEFFDSTNRECYLCAGNQLSKSSSQIRKCIDWATDKTKWKKLWPNSPDPNCFWYLYPTKDVATEEFDLKWSQFLPKGKMKEDPVYGWKEEMQNKKIYAIHFNSGISIYFKAYSQDVSDLQTGTVYAIWADEELPTSHLPELQARLNGTDGYFSMVFTATLGQEYWRRVIEGTGDDVEKPDAAKWQISLWDCIRYLDGSPSPWSPDKIKRAIARCSTKAEKARRIDGKFVLAGGRKFEAFSMERNVCARHTIPTDWFVYGAVDYGSGGPLEKHSPDESQNHPAAMSFLAVSPDFKMGRIFRAKRMDGVLTTSNDVLDEYIKQRGKLTPVLQTYDWSAKDFHTYATRRGEPFQKANKDQEEGVGTMNTLFKSGMLKIFDDDPELQKLITELTTLKATTAKRNAKDDLCDTVRYNCMIVPWDWSVLDEIEFDAEGRIKEPEAPKEKTATDLRREYWEGKPRSNNSEPDVELAEWDEMINEFDS